MIVIRRMTGDEPKLSPMETPIKELTVLVWAKFFNNDIKDWLNCNVGDELPVTKYYMIMATPVDRWFALRVLVLQSTPSGAAYRITINDPLLMVLFRLEFSDCLVHNTTDCNKQ